MSLKIVCQGKSDLETCTVSRETAVTTTNIAKNIGFSTYEM